MNNRAKKPQDTILVLWQGHDEECPYSRYMLQMIAADEACERITDGITGEILYTRDNG